MKTRSWENEKVKNPVKHLKEENYKSLHRQGNTGKHKERKYLNEKTFQCEEIYKRLLLENY